MAPSSFAPRTIHCASKYATVNYDQTMTKCNFQLNRPITVPQEYEVHISVLSASIPFSFYSVPAFTLTYAAGRSVSVVAGNWSGTDLAGLLTLAGTMAVTFTVQTGLFKFTNNSGAPITISAGSFSNTTASAPLSILGFLAAKTVGAGASVYSDYFPDIAGTRFINILSSLNTEAITTGTVTGGSGVLISLPVNVLPNQFIVFQPQNLVRNKLKEAYVSNFDITICDTSMAPLNLNNVAWELDLLIEVYIPPDLSPIYNEAPYGDLFNAAKAYHPRRVKELYP